VWLCSNVATAASGTEAPTTATGATTYISFDLLGVVWFFCGCHRITAHAARKRAFVPDEVGIWMVLTELRHISAASKSATNRELRLLVRLQVHTVSILVHIWPFDMNLTETAAEPASLPHLLPDGCVVAVVDEVWTSSLWSLSEADASAHCVEAWDICFLSLTNPIFSHADEACDRTGDSDLLPDWRVVAMRSQIVARGVLHEAIVAMNIEASMLWCNVLANFQGTLLDEWRDRAIINDGVADVLKGMWQSLVVVHLIVVHMQIDPILNRHGFPSNDRGRHSCGGQDCKAPNKEDHGDLWHPNLKYETDDASTSAGSRLLTW
jgi:hypothetical protein